MAMKISALLDEFISIAAAAGYRVIRDKGTFRGGSCLVRQEKIIVLNKRLPPESAVSAIASILAGENDEIVMKPAAREIVDREKKRAMRRASAE